MNLPSLLVIICGWICGKLLLWHIPVCKKSRVSTTSKETISVIIPARNEEGNIGILLRSLQNQSMQPHEVIVIDDNSSDNTETEALTAGAQVYNSSPRPHGWQGKSWACWKGANSAAGSVFLFLDADTELEVDGLESIYQTWVEKGGLLTVEPWHKTKRPYEQLSGFFNLIVYAAMNAFTPLRSSIRPAGGFGPCIMCSRDAYFRSGGHEAIKGKILENIAIAKNAQRSQLPVYCLSGRGTINFRMYPRGFKQLVEGWTKSMATGSADTHIFAKVLIYFWIGSALTAAGRLFSIHSSSPHQTTAILVSYAAFVFQIFGMLKQVGSFSFVTALIYPLHILFFTFIFFRSLIFSSILRKLSWKGREIETKLSTGRKR